MTKKPPGEAVFLFLNP